MHFPACEKVCVIVRADAGAVSLVDSDDIEYACNNQPYNLGVPRCTTSSKRLDGQRSPVRNKFAEEWLTLSFAVLALRLAAVVSLNVDRDNRENLLESESQLLLLAFVAL